MKNRNHNQKENKDGRGKSRNRPLLFRFLVIGLVFVLASGYLGVHLSALQIEQKDEWRAMASNQQLANVPIEPERGVIYDANMKPMAVSATVWTVEAAPNVLKNSKLKDENPEDPAKLASRELARILELDENDLYENLSDEESKYYKVKAKIEKPMADQVRQLCSETGLGGVYLRQDSKRYYPFEDLGSTVLGFTNADGNGIEGLESWYDEQLSGTPGRQVAVRNAWGGEIAAVDDGSLYPAEDGYSLVLTLDTDIQQVVEKYLASAVTQYNAKQRGMAIVMDVNTGEILALAVSPSYNPNEPYEIFDEATRMAVEAIPDSEEKVQAQGDARTLQWRNKALADTYEPGSVLKVITAAAALDSGTYEANSGFYCSSVMTVEDREFGCAQNTAHGQVSLQQALIESCNVSFIQMAHGMGASTWYDYLNAFGLTEPTGVDMPGEPGPQAINNLVYSEDQLGPVELSSCSFGQSNKFTALQMITAVSAAVNGGNLMQPYMVKQVLDADGNVVENIEPQVKRQVVSPETSAIICETMEELVSSTPNGRNAYVAGYHVGGKSGTSQKLELLTQENRQEYISSFLGFAPANDPKVAVLVVLDEPDDPEYRTFFGGRLAGPTAGSILSETLQILGVEPVYDNPEDLARTTLSCPKVTEMHLSESHTLLNQDGLTPLIVGDGDTVVAQYPEAYTQIPNGGQVVLYTVPDTPAEVVQLPDLVGMGGQGAVNMLKDMGVNAISTGAPDGGENVLVINQDVPPGTEVPKGTVITLTMQDTTAVGDH